MMKQNEIEKAANAYINSDEFPVIGYPHLAKQDFIKGAEWAKEIMIDKIRNYLWNCTNMTEEDVEMVIKVIEK